MGVRVAKRRLSNVQQSVLVRLFVQLLQRRRHSQHTRRRRLLEKSVPERLHLFGYLRRLQMHVSAMATQLHLPYEMRYIIMIALNEHLFCIYSFHVILLNKPEQPMNCPCRNGGLCVQLPSYAIGCSCRYGYTGDQCEKSKCHANY